MALVRCEEHLPEKGGRGRDYVVAVEPIGLPKTAVVCGRNGTNHHIPGYILLDESEYKQFKQGQRVFEPHSNATHIKTNGTVAFELD